MSRGLWFVAGAGAGIYAMVRGRRAVEAVSPDGLRDRAGAAALGLRMLSAEVAAGKAEREAELRERHAAGPPAVAGNQARPQIEQHDPTTPGRDPQHHVELEE